MQQLVASELTPRDVLDAATRVVKIYGAGGLGRIEAYQTGCLISPEGHVLTANSLVLDGGQVTVVTHTGDRYSAVVLGADPIAEVAVLKFDPAGESLGYFDLAAKPAVYSGQRAFALANVFGIASGDEPVSVQRCVVAAVAPLKARRGPLQRIDGDDVLILDAVTSNPGAAGGAVVDREGRLIGMLGRELTSRVTGTWLNYAAPV
ncbi:MAG: serine protease, partial [Planctomycetota bacterium]